MGANGRGRERTGFVGLGHLGRPMAERAAAQGTLDLVWQRTPGPTEALERHGVGVAGSLRELAERVDVVSLCVRDEPDALHVVEGGLADGLAGRGLVVLHSTVPPEACHRLAAACGRRDVRLIDAPVCGGPGFAAAGRLLVAVGGDARDVARARPLLDCYGQLVRHVGPLGSGERVKLLMNLLYAANVEIVCRAIEMAPEVGLAEDMFAEFVTGLPYQGFVGSTLATGSVGPGAVAHGRELLAKDVGYAEELVREAAGAGDGLLALGAAALESLGAAIERARRRVVTGPVAPS